MGGGGGAAPETQDSRNGSLLSPASVIDTSRVESGRSVEFLQDAYASNLLFSAEFPEGAFHSRIENWGLPGLAATRQVSDANKIFLTGGKRFSNPDLVYVRINLEGSNRAFFDGRSYTARTGDISILGSRGAGITDFTKRRTLVTYLPRSAVAPRPDAPLPDIIRGTSPAGRLLGAVLREFDRALPTTAVAQADTLASGLVQVVRTLLETAEPDLEQDDLAPARRTAIVAYVDRNLGKAAIDAEALGTRFGISRATLYRMFRDDGGVDTFVLERRLLRVYQDLARARNQRGTVTRIAERWGFHDPSKFANQFRRLFGLRPSDVVGSERAPEAPTTSPIAGAGDYRLNDLLRDLS